MKKNEIKVGGLYLAKVNNKLVTVRVDSVPIKYYMDKSTTVYNVTNLSTGRKTTFRSAMKFREEVPARGTEEYAALKPSTKTSGDILVSTKDQMTELEPVGHRGEHDEGEAKELTNDITVAEAMRDYAEMGVTGEAEQRPDPTPVSDSTPPSSQVSADAPIAAKPVSFLAAAEATTKGRYAESESPLSTLLRQSISHETSKLDTAPHLIVEARAGTGKTTTLVEGLKIVKGLSSDLIPSPQQKAVWDCMALSAGKVSSICFVAFNKSIAEELKRRVPAGCDAMTMHSMGFRAVTKMFGRCEPNEWVVQDIIAELLGKDIRWLKQNKLVMLRATEELVSLCKMNLTEPMYGLSCAQSPASEGWEEPLAKLASHYEVDLNHSRQEVFDLVPRVLDRCKTPRGKISFDDMIWLPVVLNLSVYQYDLLLIDERQDLNKCQMQLALKAGKRIIAVGDKSQAIYGFAGADANACENFTSLLAHHNGREVMQLPLTVTRRCGKAIVAEANKIVPDFSAHETNCEGVVGHMSYKPTPADIIQRCYTERVQDGDMVLCRVNAPLVSQCFRFIRAGRKANIQGRDIGAGLVSTVKKVSGMSTTVVNLVEKLSDWLSKETAKENAKRQPNESRVIALQDRYDCLMCFTEGVDTVDQVVAKINSIFTDNKDSSGIRLSSVHKAKGLEAKRVFILQPEGAGMPHPMAKSAWQRGQEWNILYVAITRAIEELVYVS